MSSISLKSFWSAVSWPSPVLSRASNPHGTSGADYPIHEYPHRENGELSFIIIEVHSRRVEGSLLDVRRGIITQKGVIIITYQVTSETWEGD